MMKEYSARQLKKKILCEPKITPPHFLQVLPALLDKQTSMALMTMNRSNEAHRIKNHTFKTAIQHKLRLPVIDCHQEYKCKCGSRGCIWRPLSGVQGKPQNQGEQQDQRLNYQGLPARFEIPEKFRFRAIFRDFCSRSRRNHFFRYRFFRTFLIKETEM
jgi:hypothetical protein